MTALDYFNAHSREIRGIQVLLDISLEQKILNIKVKSSPKIDQCLKTLLVGKKLDTAMQLSGADLGDDQAFLVLELELLQEAILSFVGVSLPDALEKGQSVEDLVCRCFGVYKSDINAFIVGKDISQLGLVHLTEALSAGAACGSCLDDLKFYLAQGKQELLPFPAKAPTDAEGRRLRVNGLTPREVAELLDQQLSAKGIEVMLIRPPFVLIRSRREVLSSSQLVELSTWVEAKLFLKLEFRLF